jgi:hypothetical protein
MKSRMNREVHVRFCERFGGEIPPYLLDIFSNAIMIFSPFITEKELLRLIAENLSGSGFIHLDNILYVLYSTPNLFR